MKRLICLLLVLILLLPLSGCTKQEHEFQVPVNFFYLSAAFVHEGKSRVFDCVIDFEEREALGHIEDLEYLFNEYFKGPESTELISPFPKDLTVAELRIVGDIMFLEVSDSLGQLTGMDLTIACTCITKTAVALANVKKVQISATDTLLDSSKTIFMDADALLLLDDSATPTEMAEIDETITIADSES